MKRFPAAAYSMVVLFLTLTILLTVRNSAVKDTESTPMPTAGSRDNPSVEGTSAPLAGANHYTYSSIVNRLYDLKALASKPKIDENSDQFSSHNRRSVYNEKTGKYDNWGANNWDGEGIIRVQDDGGKVITEMDGPGYITRIWSAAPRFGHIKILIDGSDEPVIDTPFKSFFSMFSSILNLHQLSYISSGGYNSYVPITYNESCKVVLYDDWGLFYHVDYTTLPENHTVEPFKMPLSAGHKKELAKVQVFFSGSLGSNPLQDTNEAKEEKSIAIEPGKLAEIFSTTKPGAITGIRVKVNNLTEPFEDWEALRELTISACWDGNDVPAVWAPVGDFFGSAGGINLYKSLPLGMQEDGWLYCWWYMPYDKGARLEIKNDGAKVRSVDIEIMTAPLDRPAEELLRFHAKWSRKADAPKDSDRWPDCLILDTKGQGRFLGFMLHGYKSSNLVDRGSGEGQYWWGEGDEKFFVDGEKSPSWFGTGTEDYFGYAWCNSALFSLPFHTQPFNSGGVFSAGNRIVNRFQIIDNIPFQESFEGYLEKYYSDEFIKYATMTYWYLDTDGVDDYKPVSLEVRTDYYKYLPQVTEMYEGEEINIKAVEGGIAGGQDMMSFGNKWSSNSQLFWHSSNVGSSLSLYIKTEKAGKYEIKANLTTAGDYGMVQFYANDSKIGEEFDGYSNGVLATGEFTIGEAELQEGLNVIKIEVTGKNDKSISYMFGLDYLKVLPLG